MKNKKKIKKFKTKTNKPTKWTGFRSTRSKPNQIHIV